MAIKRWNANTSTWELVGTPGTVTPASIGAAALASENTFLTNQVIKTYTGEGLYMYRAGGNANDIRLRTSQGTINNPTVATNGQLTGQIHFEAYDGANYTDRAMIGGIVEGPVSSGNVPTALRFLTGTTSQTEYMRIHSSGNISLATQQNKVLIGASDHTYTSAPLSIRKPIDSGASTNYAIVINDPNTNTSGGTNLIGFSHNNNDYSAANVRAAIGATIDGGGNGSLVFRTGAYLGQGERMRLDHNGNLLLNTTTSDQKLTISNGGGSGNTRIAMFSDTNHRFYVYNNSLGGAQQGGIGQGGYMEQNSVGTYSGLKTYPSFPSYQMIIRNEGFEGFHFMKQAPGSTNTDGTITPMVRIDTNGYMYIGYTSSNGAYRLQVNSQIFATSSSIATSDGRYKENVLPIASGLDIIDSLNPVSFNWKEHPVHNFVPGKTVGFIAQEVKEALKDYEWVDNIIKTNSMEAVLDEEGNEITPAEEFLGIAESNIIPLLVAAVKELRAELNTLKSSML